MTASTAAIVIALTTDQTTRDAMYERMSIPSIANVALELAKSGLTLDHCGPSGGVARAAFEAAFNVYQGENHEAQL